MVVRLYLKSAFKSVVIFFGIYLGNYFGIYLGNFIDTNHGSLPTVDLSIKLKKTFNVRIMVQCDEVLGKKTEAAS